MNPSKTVGKNAVGSQSLSGLTLYSYRVSKRTEPKCGFMNFDTEKFMRKVNKIIRFAKKSNIQSKVYHNIIDFTIF